MGTHNIFHTCFSYVKDSTYYCPNFWSPQWWPEIVLSYMHFFLPNKCKQLFHSIFNCTESIENSTVSNYLESFLLRG